MKGVVLHNGQTVLLKNEREEWELPGGKLDLGESPEECVVREIREELNVDASAGPILDTWVYTIRPDRIVLIVTYGVKVPSLEGMRCSHEHKEARIFPLEDVAGLHMPAEYKRSIAAYADLTNGQGL
jgi:mutator protein MutT